jgi:hypothetical protein
MTDARALYECGTRAITAEDHASAERYLAASLAIEPSVRTAFNLAIALRNVGQGRRALVLLREIEAGRYGEVPADRRESLARQIETNLASLATIVVALPAGAAPATVEIDGVEAQRIEADDAEARFVVEPGTHAVLATGEDACFARATLSVSRGDTQRVVVATQPCPTISRSPEPVAGTIVPDRGEPARGGSDDAVWIGVGTGAAVLVVAGAVVLGVVLGSGTEPPRCAGGVCIETLLDTHATQAELRF